MLRPLKSRREVADAHLMARSRRGWRALAGVVAVLGALTLTACDPPASVTFTGHGWGHGRGMSQWGALGYAVDHSWSGTQILNHYYGGTTTGGVTPVDQRVYLTASNGQEVRVMQTYGALRVDGWSGNLAAVRIARVGAGTFRIWGGTHCTGGWIIIGDRAASQVQIKSSVLQGNDPARMMQHCTSSGTRYYRGSMWAVDAMNTIVAVNQVATEAMLRSIVAREVSPSWADLGGGKGLAAVRSQGLAARSYMMAGDERWAPWATTCNSSALCQVYDGYGTRADGSSTIVKIEDARTDLAVSQTANQVRKFSGGTVARTEFASSSGGWTAGGDFPAVVDNGDDYAGNPNHNWSVAVSRATIESKFDTRQGHDVGTFEGFSNYSRNGLGDLGGRVLSVRANFTGEDVTLTGDQMRSLFGLKSNWFAT